MKKRIEPSIDKIVEVPIIPVKKLTGKGGARPGAGRRKGSTQEISVNTLLAKLKEKSGGKDYEDLLVTDFLIARTKDPQLTHKYHTLILGKVMNTLAKIEVTDSADAVESKKLAFADALAKLTGIEKD
jgi:hypothetical protein